MHANLFFICQNQKIEGNSRKIISKIIRRLRDSRSSELTNGTGN